MCDDVFYKSEGEVCGIYNKKIGQVFTGTYEHHVCANGLACFQTIDFQGSDLQICMTVKKEVGEQCLPDYNHCIFTYGCSKNAYEAYTCDAKSLWKGNIGMDYTEIYRPVYKQDYALLIVGIMIIAFWGMGIIVFITNRYGREESTDDELLNNNDKSKVLF